MKRKERNTDVFSPEFIWVHRMVARLWFNHNDQHKYNTVPATITFLKKVDEDARRNGWEDIVVKPTYSEATCDSLEQYYIEVWAYRLETVDEHRRRLRHELALLRRKAEDAERNTKYVASDDYKKRVKEYEDGINFPKPI